MAVSTQAPRGESFWELDPSGKRRGRSLPPWGLFKMWGPSLLTAAPQRWEGSKKGQDILPKCIHSTFGMGLGF